MPGYDAAFGASDKVCGCGAPFLGDEQFCRKCGARRVMIRDESDWQIYLRKALYISTTPTFLKVCFGTWLCFIVTLLLFTYGYMMVPQLCWIWSAMVILLIIFALAIHILARPGQITVALATGCLIAVVFGSVVGMYNYDTAAIFPMFYRHARKYTNVVASEPSAAVADAGKITFGPQTRVDVNKSVGYIAESGITYCVAPIMDSTKQPRIEFWAAGVDCCIQSGDFHCDSSQDEKAQGGVVIFDNNGWFEPARYPYYEQARAKAESQHMLQSVAEPLFVRWVEKDNLDYLENYYSRKAGWTSFGISVAFLILSAILSCAMWQPRSMVASGY